MSDIKSLIQNPELKKYAAETRANNRNVIAEFLAPTVPVPSNFRFSKEWKADEAPLVVDTRRALGGKSARITVFYPDTLLKSAPHCVEAAIDRSYLEGSDEESLFLLRQALDVIAIESEFGRERAALSKAIATAGEGTDVTWGPSDDPIELIDLRVQELMKQAKCPFAGVLFGAGAFHSFKHHPIVRGRIKGGLSYTECPGLFHNNSRFETTYGLQKADGTAGFDFVLKDSILIFARTPRPNTSSRDWLKSLENNAVMQVPQLRLDISGRDALVWCAWEQSIERTNEAGVIRLNLVR